MPSGTYRGTALWVDASAGLPLDVRGPDYNELINLSALVIDPINPSTLYVGSCGFYENDGVQPRPNPLIPTGVFRSSDGGNSWSQHSGGLPRIGTSVNTVLDVHALAVHPRKPGILWASTVQPGQVSRIYRTLDGGANWLPSGEPLAHCDVRDLLVDPSAPQIVYASGITIGASEGCVFRSEDDGANWISLHVGVGVTAS